jgi:hypothetical protein
MKAEVQRVDFSWRVPLIAVCAASIGVICTVAHADEVLPCTPDTCTWTVAVGGKTVETGSYTVDPTTGAIEAGPASWSGGGSNVSVQLSGNSDPILGFNVSAGTSAAAGNSFSLTFSMPISLAGPIDASSSVSYSLTSTSGAGAQIQPSNGHVVTAQEVSSIVGGPAPFNKGVDVGNAFQFNTGPATQNSQIFTAANMFTLVAGNQYDLMSVTVAFTLSASSNVGISGFVEQTAAPVPLPGSIWLLLSGMLGMFGLYGLRPA